MWLTTGSYVGTGVDGRQITGVGFQPDVVIVKSAVGRAGVIRTGTMVGDAAKILGTSTALQPNQIQSFIADGFTVGTENQVNRSNETYYWVAMRAGSNLSVGSYVGNGSDNRSITGVGFQPVWVITLGDGEDSAFRPASLSGDNSCLITGTGNVSNRIQALEAGGFQIGSNSDVNKSGTTYHYIAWAASPQVSQGSYTGNGLDNRSITGVGFQPQMVWVKRDDAQASTWRPASALGDTSLYWSATAAAADRIQALQADGFQVGTNAQVNTNAMVYYYLALRDGR
jgi:phage protein U